MVQRKQIKMTEQPTKAKSNPEVVKLIAIAERSQAQLAKDLGTTENRISEYKTGKKAMNVQRLKSWCQILNIDIKTLF